MTDNKQLKVPMKKMAKPKLLGPAPKAEKVTSKSIDCMVKFDKL